MSAAISNVVFCHPSGVDDFVSTRSGGVAALAPRLLSGTPPASGSRRSYPPGMASLPGNPEGCQTVAGGRSAAETSGRHSKINQHPGGVQG